MRRVILAACCALFLAGTAAALPTGPGGTLYFSGYPCNPMNSTGAIVETQMYYIDLNTDWSPVESENICKYLTTLPAVWNPYWNGTYNEYGSPELFWNEETGQRDMAGEYHNARIAVLAPADTTADPGSTPLETPDPTGNNPNRYGSDILLVNGSTGAYTTLNAGFDGPSSPDTYNAGGLAVVDSGFTPEGEARGLFVPASNGTIWVEKDADGIYNDYDTITVTSGGSIDTGRQLDAYGNCMYGSGYLAAYVAYKTGPNTYTRTTITDATMTALTPLYTVGTVNHYATVGSTSVGTITDIDDDGNIDFFWSVGGNSGDIIHAEDTDGDGLFITDGECQVFMSGSTGPVPAPMSGTYQSWDLQFVKTEGGGGVLLWFGVWNLYSTSDNGGLWAFGVDADGAYDGTYMMIGYVNEDSNDGDLSMNGIVQSTGSGVNQTLNGGRSFVFAPLGEAGEIPEPGTMLLVGSGILGLAGVVRRRLIG